MGKRTSKCCLNGRRCGAGTIHSGNIFVSSCSFSPDKSCALPHKTSFNEKCKQNFFKGVRKHAISTPILPNIGECFGKRKLQTSPVLASEKRARWICKITSATCAYCASQHGCVIDRKDPNTLRLPAHENCRCKIVAVPALLAGTATEHGVEGVDYYLFLHGCLPENYMTQAETKIRGWKQYKGNLWDVLPKVVIGGKKYMNIDGRLTTVPGRIWYEADFDYRGGYRNRRRILFSNDGLVFATRDHYLTFFEVYWEEV